MPINRLCAAVLLLTMPLLFACTSTNAIPREFEVRLAGSAEQLDKNARLRADLDLPITLDFIDTPLREVISHITQQSGLPLAVDWAALKDTDMKPETRVTMQMANAPVREAFNTLFRTITAPDLEDSSPLWMATDGLVIIGTVQSLLPHRKTISYPVADILDKLDPGTIDVPDHDKGKATATAAAFRIVEKSPPAPGDDSDEDDVREALFALIEDASGVRPEMWDSHEGVLCVMNETAGVLVLTAPDEVQRRTFQALQSLRTAIEQTKK